MVYNYNLLLFPTDWLSAMVYLFVIDWAPPLPITYIESFQIPLHVVSGVGLTASSTSGVKSNSCLDFTAEKKRISHLQQFTLPYKHTL